MTPMKVGENLQYKTHGLRLASANADNTRNLACILGKI